MTKRKTADISITEPAVAADVTQRSATPKSTTTKPRTSAATHKRATKKTAPEAAAMPAAANTPALTHLSHEEIARLAYSYWQACGCQDGSSEQDWLRAERDLLELAQNR